MERAEARALTEEREKQEAAAEWARSAALESARAKAEEARVRRARFEAKAAEDASPASSEPAPAGRGRVTLKPALSRPPPRVSGRRPETGVLRPSARF